MFECLRVVVLVVGLGLVAPSLSLAEASAWDQAEVTKIAAELVPAVEAAYHELESRQIADRSPRQYYRLRETVRRIRSEARRLANGLAKGEGHDQTLPVYEQLALQVRDAQEIARRIFVASPLHDKFAAAGVLLDRLAPFYATAAST